MKLRVMKSTQLPQQGLLQYHSILLQKKRDIKQTIPICPRQSGLQLHSFLSSGQAKKAFPYFVESLKEYFPGDMKWNVPEYIYWVDHNDIPLHHNLLQVRGH